MFFGGEERQNVIASIACGLCDATDVCRSPHREGIRRWTSAAVVVVADIVAGSRARKAFDNVREEDNIFFRQR